MSGNRLKRKVYEGVPNRTLAPSVYFYSCQTRPLHTTITPPATSLKPASIRRRRDYVHANSRRKSSASNLLIPNHKLRHLASPPEAVRVARAQVSGRQGDLYVNKVAGHFR